MTNYYTKYDSQTHIIKHYYKNDITYHRHNHPKQANTNTQNTNTKPKGKTTIDSLFLSPKKIITNTVGGLS